MPSTCFYLFSPSFPILPSSIFFSGLWHACRSPAASACRRAGLPSPPPHQPTRYNTRQFISTSPRTGDNIYYPVRWTRHHTVDACLPDAGATHSRTTASLAAAVGPYPLTTSCADALPTRLFHSSDVDGSVALLTFVRGATWRADGRNYRPLFNNTPRAATPPPFLRQAGGFSFLGTCLGGTRSPDTPRGVASPCYPYATCLPHRARQHYPLHGHSAKHYPAVRVYCAGVTPPRNGGDGRRLRWLFASVVLPSAAGRTAFTAASALPFLAARGGRAGDGAHSTDGFYAIPNLHVAYNGRTLQRQHLPVTHITRSILGRSVARTDSLRFGDVHSTSRSLRRDGISFASL